MSPGPSAQVDASLTFVEGDTWGGIPSIAILVAGVPPAVDVASAKMQFRPAVNSSDTLLELTSAAATITIVSVNGWTFIVPAQFLALVAGLYNWAFQTVDISGAIQTYLEGTILVLPKGVY